MKFLLIPVFLQIALTFGLTLALATSRVAAAKSGAVKLSDIAVNSNAWPDKVRQIANSYSNQFEQPMLFYVLVVLASVAGFVDTILIVGAWLFVASRSCHAYVHVADNNVLTRFKCFAAGVANLSPCGSISRCGCFSAEFRDGALGSYPFGSSPML